MSRAYCEQEHPGSDQEADAWCAMYHRPAEPVRSPEDAPAEEGEPMGDVGDMHVCDTCGYPLDADVPWHARLPEGTMCLLTPPSPERAP